MKLNIVFTIGLFTCSSLLGCGGDAAPVAPSQAETSHDHHGHDHAHHDEGEHAHAETFGEAVADIAAKRDAIKVAMEADDLKKADGPVHGIGHVLEQLEELATKQGLEGDKLVQVTSARDSLFEAFAELDKTIHGKTNGKSWEEVADEIDKAIIQLQELTSETPATETPATETPATETPATETPATEAPATEAPATEAPATEVPETEAPATEAAAS